MSGRAWVSLAKMDYMDDLARRGILFKPGTDEYTDLAKTGLHELEKAFGDGQSLVKAEAEQASQASK